MFAPDPFECAGCGRLGHHSWAVPWYYGPVSEWEDSGGYKACCARCYQRWLQWNESTMFWGS